MVPELVHRIHCPRTSTRRAAILRHQAADASIDGFLLPLAFFATDADLLQRLLDSWIQIREDDGTVDLLYSNVTLQWCNDLENTFREFLRVLRPGGRFVCHEVFGVDGSEPHFPVPWATGSQFPAGWLWA